MAWPVTAAQQRLLPPCSWAGAMLGPVRLLERRDGVPRWTARMRLALAYGALFVLSGTALLTISYLFVAHYPFGGVVHLVSSSGHTVSSPGPLKSPPPGSVKSLSPGNHVVRDSAVQTALNAQRSADLHALVVWFGVALGITAAASVLLGWLMAGRVLRPLQRIATTARHISEENLHQRLALAGPSDEITDLADTIDGLLARLEGAFDAQRAFVANASHELRTPLAMMRTSLDVAAAKTPPLSTDASVLSAKVREGLDQAERLVESFLVLARAQRGVIDDLTTVSLPQITANALETRADGAAAANLALGRSLGVADVAGSRTLLSRLALNLIDNAMRHNQPGGWVHVTTTTEGQSSRLIIENGGPILDTADVGQLGRPFWRGGEERTRSDGGVGLGLSIVVAIAAAHHGTVELEARPDGGMRVVVDLPRATSAGPEGGLP